MQVMNYPKAVRVIIGFSLAAIITAVPAMPFVEDSDVLSSYLGSILLLPGGIVAVMVGGVRGGGVHGESLTVLIIANVICYGALFYGLLGFSKRFRT